MSVPTVAVINTGIAQHFKWHMSPDDFEDSPRGPPPALPFEYPQATFTSPPKLPTLLTSFAPTSVYAPKPLPQTFVAHSAPVTLPTNFAGQPEFAQTPETCLLSTGLSRMGNIPQVNASHRFVPGMHFQHCSATMLPVQTSMVNFGDFGASDHGAKLWQEPTALAVGMVTLKQMCDYCCVRQSTCFSDCDGNPEMYCDVCRLDGDQRWCDYRAELQKKTGDDKNGVNSQRGDLIRVPPRPPSPVSESATLGQSASQVQDSCASTAKVEPRKKGRSKKIASQKALERQAKDPTPNPVDPGDWEEGTTTVMMRNIPSRYTVEELVSEMVIKNFGEQFDYLYLPMDFKTKRNKGYAFINFVSAQLAIQFHADFNGVQLPKYGTQKTLQIARAETQGLEANLNAAQRDKPRITNPWFRPMVFSAGQE